MAGDPAALSPRRLIQRTARVQPEHPTGEPRVVQGSLEWSRVHRNIQAHVPERERAADRRRIGAARSSGEPGGGVAGGPAGTRHRGRPRMSSAARVVVTSQRSWKPPGHEPVHGEAPGRCVFEGRSTETTTCAGHAADRPSGRSGRSRRSARRRARPMQQRRSRAGARGSASPGSRRSTVSASATTRARPGPA